MVLSGAGVDVLVLEARDRVGGRLLTVHPFQDQRDVFIDHGGQWVSAGQDRLLTLAGELGVPLFPTWGGGATVDWHNGQRSTYTGLFPSYWSEADKSQVIAAVQQLQGMANSVPLDAPWLAPDAAQSPFGKGVLVA
jgi:monoamine oxidase